MIAALLFASVTQVIDLQGLDGLGDGHFDGTALTRAGAVITAPRFAQTKKVAGPVLRALADGSALLSSPLRWVAADGTVRFKDKARSLGDLCNSKAGSYLSAMPGGLLRHRKSPKAAWTVVALPHSHRSLWALSCTKKGAVVAAGQPSALYRLEGTKVVAQIKVPGDGLRSVATFGDMVIAGGLKDGRVWSWQGDQLRVLFVTEGVEVRRLLQLSKDAFAALSVGGERSTEGDLPAATPFSAGSGSVERFSAKTAAADLLWASAADTPMDMLHHKGELWLGSDSGQIYRISLEDADRNARRTYWRSSMADERAIEALAWVGGKLTLYGGGIVRQQGNGAHRYRTVRLTAGGVIATWGNLRVDSNAVAQVRWRFGNDEKGEGWSNWTNKPGGRSHFAQIELTLKPGAKLKRIEQFLRTDNRGPRMLSTLLLDQGSRIQAKPDDLVWDKGFDLPDGELKQFIAAPLRWDRPEAGEERAKIYWRQGYRSLIWKGEDPDEDALVYRVTLLRLLKSGPKRVDRWHQRAHFRSLKTAALAHGSYQLSISVRDGESEWSAPLLSQAFAVDHRAPRLKLQAFNLKKRILKLQATDDDRVVAVRCGEGSNSVDLVAADGVADGVKETFILPDHAWVEALQLKRCETIDPAGNRAGLDLP